MDMHCLGQIANTFWRLRVAIKFVVVVNAGNMRFRQDLTSCTSDLHCLSLGYQFSWSSGNQSKKLGLIFSCIISMIFFCSKCGCLSRNTAYRVVLLVTYMHVSHKGLS